ncbi:MAG: sulfurtransferase [Acidimicrobiaceae bacterium]|mgnify:CR=1 FL=1|nr:sulfurtransferase [Acidimicrobiaceae bacterium]
MPFTEISVADAYRLLADDPSAVLIDVRTPEEWAQIGVATLDSIGKQVRFATWTWYGTGERNPNFLAEATEGLDMETPLLFLCRSGARSQGAAMVAEASGFGTTYNVTQGFEGGPGAAGWKYAGLPWTQG